MNSTQPTQFFTIQLRRQNSTKYKILYTTVKSYDIWSHNVRETIREFKQTPAFVKQIHALPRHLELFELTQKQKNEQQIQKVQSVKNLAIMVNGSPERSPTPIIRDELAELSTLSGAEERLPVGAEESSPSEDKENATPKNSRIESPQTGQYHQVTKPRISSETPDKITTVYTFR
jgi:hypothetical protein